MRKQHAFNPRALEILEDRAVPSTMGISTPTGIPGISVILPGQVSPEAPRVQAAFAAFDRSYLQAVDDVLLAPGPGGLVVPAANRPAFDAAVVKSLDALALELVQALTPSAAPAVASQVVDAIVGSGRESLENQLLSMPTTAIGANLPIALTTSVNAANQGPVPLVVTTAEQVRPTLRPPVAEEAGTSTFPADPPASAASTKASQDIRSAFGAFLDDYFQAVRGVLLAPGDGGQVDPKAHRADFDARVDQALRSLDSRLSSTLIRFPSASALAPQVRASIEGDDASSLKSQLASLATPQDSRAAIVRDFTLGSTRAVARALSMISGDVSNLLGR